MPDLQLTFNIGSTDPAPVEEALTLLGATSVTLEDAADNPVLEPAPGETPLWPTIRIRALFQADADRAAIEAGLDGVFELRHRCPIFNSRSISVRPTRHRSRRR